MIMFPSEYPFKPPGIKARVQLAPFGCQVSPEADFPLPLVQMITPSGRFTPNHKICFSMSDYHPGTVRRSTEAP